MCLIVIKPQESAASAAAKLRKAAQDMARAQAEMLAAADTLAMFERNFQMGYYMERPQQEMQMTHAQVGAMAASMHAEASDSSTTTAGPVAP